MDEKKKFELPWWAWILLGLLVLFALIGFGDKVVQPKWLAGEWFATPVPGSTATPIPSVESTAMPPAADGKTAPDFVKNFNTSDVDFTEEFGHKDRTVVFVMTDQERLSCVVPEENISLFDDKFGWKLFNNVFIDGVDTLEVDVVSTISSADAKAYQNCWDIPVKQEMYRAMVVGENAIQREYYLEKQTGGTVYTVIRDTSTLQESSVPEVLDDSATEYKNHSIVVVRYQLSNIDVKPAYIFPAWSPYVAP